MGKTEAGSHSALITGGAGQLGRFVVRRFAAAIAPIHIPLLDPSEAEPLLTFLGPAASSVRLHPGVDLGNPASVEALMTEIQRSDGRLPRILLNLAGGFSSAPLEETEPEGWNRMWAMNASSAFLTSRALFPTMKAHGWGRIVNVSALPALDRGKANLSAYGAAKAAVLNLTHTLAKEGVPHGITVNAVLPSIIDTPGNRAAMPQANRSHWIPPEEVASVLFFLASEEARVVNGAAIPLTLG